MSPAWYQETRREVERVVADCAVGARAAHMSPSGRYGLEVTLHPTGTNTWAYSRGIVREAASGRIIAKVSRNFDAFPFSWAEDHPTGHDYLIAGEDYQGQTVVELDTGARVDHIPDEAAGGAGFCWAAHYPSADGRVLFVDGCFWGAQYELVLFDFSAPMHLPYRELKRWPVWEVHGFAADGSFTFDYPQEIRKADGVPVEQLTEAEQEALEAMDYRDAVGERRVRVIWHPDSTETVSVLP